MSPSKHLNWDKMRTLTLKPNALMQWAFFGVNVSRNLKLQTDGVKLIETTTEKLAEVEWGIPATNALNEI